MEDGSFVLTVVDFFACFLFVLCCSCLTIGCLLDLKFVMGVKDCCIVVWLLHGLLQRHRLGSWGTREMAVLSWREALSASLLGMTPTLTLWLFWDVCLGETETVGSGTDGSWESFWCIGIYRVSNFGDFNWDLMVKWQKNDFGTDSWLCFASPIYLVVQRCIFAQWQAISILGC